MEKELLMTLPDPEDRSLSDALYRVNRLGSASEKLFSRLYQGMNRRALDELQNENQAIRDALKRRSAELNRLNSILAALDQGVVMQDNDGRLVLVNRIAKEFLGNVKNFWDSPLGDLFNQYRGVEGGADSLVPLGEPTRAEIGGRVIGAQIAIVSGEQGERLGTIMILRDVTRETLGERLKEHFITAISHELRTPMAVIKGMSDVIASSEGAPNRRLLETLARNVEILDRMIVELLDVSELSGGEFSIRSERIDVEDLLWRVVGGQSPEIKRSGLDVSVLVRDASALVVTGDDQRLRWALGHLLQNAVHYTEQGGHILVTASLTDAAHLTIQVSDTGAGIRDQDMPYIFDRFYRGKARTVQGRLIDPRGLGQGLFIAQKVIQAHGGDVAAASAPGQGSVFTAVLPRAER
ncbi:MAG: PAS domain-containing sensor histidine kinase [Chloroflexota bacterium]|nr:PAS domain-containing sensor histidine kinase [Chloroflexota bacterium]